MNETAEERIHAIGEYISELEQDLEDQLRITKAQSRQIKELIGELEALRSPRTCPSPGGCESCPNPVWCLCMRLQTKVTQLDEEMGYLEEEGKMGVYNVIFTDCSTSE